MKLTDLVADPKNRRKHTARNLEMLQESIEQVGTGRSIVIDEDDVVLAGNATITAASKAGLSKVTVIEAKGDEVIAVRRTGLSEKQKRDLAMYDNRTAELAEWDGEQLAEDQEAGLEFSAFFEPVEFEALVDPSLDLEGLTDPDAVPEKRETSIHQGDLFALGDHRLLCGDTTDASQVARLAGETLVTLVHADPPYGMGKDVVNDDLSNEKLDAFQLRWWRAWRPRLLDNGSVYIWGTAPDLWRLWYRTLVDEPKILLRNELVWLKPSSMGMLNPIFHSYGVATERCLFLMVGQQFLDSGTTADYWEGYEPFRLWLLEQRDAAGFSVSIVDKLTNTQMAGHWFTKSQFRIIGREHYETLREAAKGKAFCESYEEVLDRIFPGVRDGGNSHARSLTQRLHERRSYFDNEHEIMTDVWQCGRVSGEDRHGHATPKPIALVRRAIKTSSPPNAVIGVPFGGTGPEFIVAEQTNRRAVGMEILPSYCQVIIDRWEAFTGKTATKVRS